MAARTPLPFLYHTRTILRRPRTSTFACPLPKCFGSTSEPRAHQNEVNVQQTRPKTHKGHGPDINIRSSITPTERKAFEAILRSSKPPENVQSQPALVDATDIDVDNILEMFGTFIKSQHDISHTSTSPVETSPDHDNPSSSTSKSGPHEGDDSVTMAIVHRQMHEIVEALQQAAASTQQPGDIALWHACEARVFSLGQGFHQQPIYHPPKFLGPPKFTFTANHSDMPLEILEKEQKRHRAEFEAKEHHGSTSNHFVTPPPHNTAASGPGEGQDPIPDPRQARAVLHHLYPAALLYALRLFARTFPSSHFAFNLLPRIRELGHTSYVLGASTQFYNSLMSLKWHRHSSLREIHQLLSEMERGGVEFNEETGRVIGQIVNERREADVAVNSGSTGRTAAWWARHEQAFWYPRILEWQDVVADQLSSHETEAALPLPSPSPSPSGADSHTHSDGSNGPHTQRPSADEPFKGVLDEALHTLKQIV